jgi:pSer/pThr/pTyr-binding forkhead associated (FHA) protein
MQVRLVVTNQVSNESSRHDLAGEEKIILGRHLGSPVLFQGEGLSRHHFSLMVVDGDLTIEDLSSNGTWLNSVLLKGQEPARVKSGDVVEIPGYEIRVLINDAVEAPKPEAAPPAAMVLEESEPPAKRATITTAALKSFEPREVALLLFAMLSFALISFILNL